ncbi:mediator of RNA polymerase II transcription subunit 28 [Octopus bimaculoides]|uniref:Mediator of RNA polymerase II transcription subunit 28 n=1 Tax=Octopus bimaculoides TaxID=37653 RepID=A0A0L8G7A3_OCTBM|nr:mediator of RNA polymerase II transcription subunit 28 [Octopus bimaculoides]|eukprot:XP_014783723.1 PREDICTED: mediator of RNA polymerase II transcription subunit 28-like [Octopus bimaculoides]
MAMPSTERSNEHNLIDELETAFQNCLSLLTSQEYFNVTDSEETKAGIEHALQRFLEVGRQMEAFFLRKRMILSIQKPEQVIKEEFTDLEQELLRKESLLQKHQHRLQQWQSLLCNLQSAQQQTSIPQPTSKLSQQPQSASNSMPLHTMQSNMANYSQHPPPSNPTGMQPASQSLVMPPPQQPGYQQTPLAFLEQTMSNIGMP